MASSSLIVAATLVLTMSADLGFKPIDARLSNEKVLKYQGCVLKRTVAVYDRSLGIFRASAVLAYKSRTIRTVQVDFTDFSAKEAAAWIGFGLQPLLGHADDQQIVMKEYSGGAHCCLRYWVYALSPAPVEIYSSQRWGLVGDMRCADVDHDGVLEISQVPLTFDYFDRCCHGASAMPMIILRYDPSRREYLPANDLYAAELLMEENRSIEDPERVEMKQDDVGGFYLGAVLRIVLPYMYAGRDGEGWEVFEQMYRLPDKAEMTAKIRAALDKDKVYRFIHRIE